jgi:hypothetical protein
MKVIQHSIYLIFIFAHLHCESYKLSLGRQFISQSRFMLNNTVTIVKVRKVGGKKVLKKKFFQERTVLLHTKLIATPTALNFAHTTP